ncbi:hypothetical protein BTM25_35520 [Actinomadura rubteroloni]|uniref:Uncharacterized protein n=1 Tax=Actinomadura rubteroloni TaxID=1926885 RepID=A0A2P4UIN9_9ACTN|nr:hypothetical protein [Actinomadura rubteroloni]POM24913.1 hypothetical protein BTM25_35520 [Actinomadura rubteroloni]
MTEFPGNAETARWPQEGSVEFFAYYHLVPLHQEGPSKYLVLDATGIGSKVIAFDIHGNNNQIFMFDPMDDLDGRDASPATRPGEPYPMCIRSMAGKDAYLQKTSDHEVKVVATSPAEATRWAIIPSEGGQRDHFYLAVYQDQDLVLCLDRLEQHSELRLKNKKDTNYTKYMLWCRPTLPMPYLEVDCSIGKFGELGATWWREAKLWPPTGRRLALPQGTKVGVVFHEQWHSSYWFLGWKYGFKGKIWKVPGWAWIYDLYNSGLWDDDCKCFRGKTGGRDVSGKQGGFPRKESIYHSFRYIPPGDDPSGALATSYTNDAPTQCNSSMTLNGLIFW